MAEVSLSSYLNEIAQLIDEDRLDEAVLHCRFVLQQYPRHLQTYRLLGKTRLEQGDYAGAIDVLQRVLVVDPEDLLAHAGLAIAHRELGQPVEARWHLLRAYEADPYNTVLQRELRELRVVGSADGPRRMMLTRAAAARLLVRGQLYEQAIVELRQLLREQPERIDLQVLLADALWHADHRIEAVGVCLHILDRLPNCVKANAILAEIWFSMGRTEEAQHYLRRVQEVLLLDVQNVDPDSPVGTAFARPGAMALPGDVRVQRLPEALVWESSLGSEQWSREPVTASDGEQGSDAAVDWLMAFEVDTDRRSETGDNDADVELRESEDAPAQPPPVSPEITSSGDQEAEADSQSGGSLPEWIQEAFAAEVVREEPLPDWLHSFTEPLSAPEESATQTAAETGEEQAD